MRLRSPMDERSRILLAHLRSKDPSREDYVRRALAEMGQDDAVSMLLDWMDQTRRTLRAVPIYLACTMMLSCAGIALVDWMFGSPAFIQGGVTSGVVSTVITVIYTRRLRASVFGFLASYDDKRILNVLVEAIRRSDKAASSAAEKALIHILPTLRPGDEHVLTLTSRFTLNHWLLECSYPPLVGAILAACEQVGDNESVALVERLSRGEGVLGGDTSIRHAAAEALPAVREAANRAASAQTLLRPAGTESNTGALLRPPPPPIPLTKPSSAPPPTELNRGSSGRTFGRRPTSEVNSLPRSGLA